MGTSARVRTPSTTEALALLTLPTLDQLTEQQSRGIVCVWDGVPLRTAIAVNLGAREASRAGGQVTWYPRSCRRCTYTAAYAQLCVHAVSDACPNDVDQCPACRGFLRLMREYRR